MVGVAVGVVAVVVMSLALARTSQPQTPIEQVAAWTDCLRGEGADVPSIEPLPDGGFRLTVDGSLLEQGVDLQGFASAFRACTEVLPDGLTDILDRLGGAGSWSGSEAGTWSAIEG